MKEASHTPGTLPQQLDAKVAEVIKREHLQELEQDSLDRPEGFPGNPLCGLSARSAALY